MIYKNKCTECGLVEEEQRALADYNKPSPCTSCDGETKMVLSGTTIQPFTEGPIGKL